MVSLSTPPSELVCTSAAREPTHLSPVQLVHDTRPGAFPSSRSRKTGWQRRTGREGNKMGITYSQLECSRCAGEENYGRAYPQPPCRGVTLLLSQLVRTRQEAAKEAWGTLLGPLVVPKRGRDRAYRVFPSVKKPTSRGKTLRCAQAKRLTAGHMRCTRHRPTPEGYFQQHAAPAPAELAGGRSRASPLTLGEPFAPGERREAALA